MKAETNKIKLYAFGKKLPIDLSLSENPLGCSPKVLKMLKITKADIMHYPDPSCLKLKRVIKSKFDLKEADIFVGAGSEQIIQLLPKALLDIRDEVIIPSLTFPMFEMAVKQSGNKLIRTSMTKDLSIDLLDIQKKIRCKTKMIIVCNPNNPTGNIIPRQGILELADKTKAIVVVDEANIEFGGESVIRDVENFSNLVVLRTFSKAFGLAGLRVGFCVASKAIVEKLGEIKQPFPVSTVAQNAAIISLSDNSFIAKTKLFMQKERVFLEKNLNERGFNTFPSQANNLLVKVQRGFIRKLNEKAVSVVEGDSFPALGERFMRISPRDRKTNQKFLQVVDLII